MERRLQKDFQIGIVEGIVNSVIQSEKEPKDVFSQLARAIGKRSSGSKKKDWNAVVRQSTIARDPIGSRTDAQIRQTRRSLRIHQRNHPESDLASLDPNRLVEYNPNLSEVSPATRVAYAKFIMGKMNKAELNRTVSFEKGILFLLFMILIFFLIIIFFLLTIDIKLLKSRKFDEVLSVKICIFKLYFDIFIFSNRRDCEWGKRW